MSKKVLVVEDYADVRKMMKILISSYGYHVLEAADGYEAIEKTKQHHPDLILMDLMMPVMDGLTATQIIREIEGYELPILAVTAYDKTHQQKAIQAGCTDVIGKPLDFRGLEPLLKRYLN